MKEKFTHPFTKLTFKDMTKLVNSNINIEELNHKEKAYLDFIKFIYLMMKHYNSLLNKTKSNIKAEEYVNYIILTIKISFINNKDINGKNPLDEAINVFKSFANLDQEDIEPLKKGINDLFKNIDNINSEKLPKKLIKKAK